MDWECGNFDGNLAAGTKFCGWFILPSILQDGYTDPTLMSTRMFGTVQSSVAPAADSIVAVGLIVWNGVDDVAPTASNCPGPITDCDADWIWWWAVPEVAGPSVIRTVVSDSAVIISQARRKLGNDKGVLWAVESKVSVYAYHFHGRCLIKE